MLIVLNEWIFHDLWGENGESSQRETVQFLSALVQSADILIVPSEPRWSNKANRLMEFTDARRRVISKVFRSLYDDSERTIRIRADIAEIVPDEAEPVAGKSVYLVYAYLLGNADVLVTTDVPLWESLATVTSSHARSG